MKSSNRTLLAGLILAVASFSGAAHATTVLDKVYTEASEEVSAPAPEGAAGIGPSASLPEIPSWALMMLGVGANFIEIRITIQKFLQLITQRITHHDKIGSKDDLEMSSQMQRVSIGLQ